MARCSLAAAAVLGLASTVLAAACAQPRDAVSADCRMRVVVGFAAATEPNEIAAIGSAHAAQLAVVERLLPDLYVLDLAAVGGEAACNAALARIREDHRVRDATPDTRRAGHAG